MAFKKYTQGPVSMVHHNIVCSCGNDEHQLNFRYFVEDEDERDIIYCTVHLTPERNIFKRVWGAIKYIFGYRSKYGDFDEILLNKDQVSELKSMIESFEKFNEVK